MRGRLKFYAAVTWALHIAHLLLCVRIVLTPAPSIKSCAIASYRLFHSHAQVVSLLTRWCELEYRSKFHLSSWIKMGNQVCSILSLQLLVRWCDDSVSESLRYRVIKVLGRKQVAATEPKRCEKLKVWMYRVIKVYFVTLCVCEGRETRVECARISLDYVRNH